MKEQKNIERLFQEKFKDFEVAPPEMAWNNIEARLNKKKKKRRVIPFWFKASGIAASLLLGFYTYSLFNNNEDVDLKNNENTIVIDTKKNKIKNQNNRTRSFTFYFQYQRCSYFRFNGIKCSESKSKNYRNKI